MEGQYEISDQNQEKIDKMIIKVLLKSYLDEKLISQKEYNEILNKIMCTLNMANIMC